LTIDLFKNNYKYNFLLEEIRNNVLHLSTLKWTKLFGCVKAHIGLEVNEAADKLVKEASHDENDQNILYDSILITFVTTKINKQGLIK